MTYLCEYHNMMMHSNPLALQLIKDDPYLEPYAQVFAALRTRMDQLIANFSAEGGLEEVSLSYQKYGFHSTGVNQEGLHTYRYQEWAPNAADLTIFGDFNGWDRQQFHAIKNEYGHWKCELALHHPIESFSKLKCQVTLADGQKHDRIPAWINYAVQNHQSKVFDGAFLGPDEFKFQHPRPKWENHETSLRVYECHIGMSGVEPKIHSYTHFKDEVLPYIDKLGYNTIQIMAILEHPYYGSFGYHVSNFFAVSSRFGTPREFKELVDEAHARGIKVIIDLVHAHAAKNINEGINYWDGTDYQYFHSGEKGIHQQWDSRIFDFSKYEVLRFLLSNIRYWMEEYLIDGFRFDAVTSMIYKHHGINFGFTGNYHEYFSQDYLDHDALAYLMAANLLAKHIYPDAILIAEDVSGFPGLCRSHEDGGIGFTHRLAMAIPDMWIKHLKEIKDEEWDMEHIVHQLTNRRWKEKCICYAESHDQALVGDKTISMWLFDAQIYTNMSVLNEETPVVFRGIALHKMIRLLTMGLGGQAYLTFMGNQFGHPEWVDFPRQGNNWSYHYCRRRWDLSSDKDLRYKYLLEFDRALLGLDRDHNILGSSYQFVRTKNNKDKIIVFEKGDVLFVFNWHPNNCYEDYPVYVKSAAKVSVMWSTEDTMFGGHGRVHRLEYGVQKVDDFCGFFKVFLPNRSATVFRICSA